MKQFLLPALALLGLAPLAARAEPPATMLELSRSVPTPARLSESVVIIVDAQREYTDGRLRLTGIATALTQTQRLLLRARAAGVPVIHIQQISPAGRGLFEPTGPFTAIAPEAAPQPGEIVITKSLPNSFAQTTLAEALSKIGRKRLILSGYMTHVCVSATVRSALDHGYLTTIVADACATRDLPDGAGGVIPADIVHRVALAELADRFATIVPTLDAIPD